LYRCNLPFVSVIVSYTSRWHPSATYSIWKHDREKEEASRGIWGQPIAGLVASRQGTLDLGIDKRATNHTLIGGYRRISTANGNLVLVFAG